MRHSKCAANSLVLVALLLLGTTEAAHAYVDPGTGSYVIQILIAALAGAAFAIKIYWSKIKGLFSRSSSGSDEPGNDGQ